MVGLGRYQSGQALFSPLKLRSEGLAPASAAQSADAIVFAISCQYDNSRPRHHAVANHQIYMPSYLVVSTLSVPAMLRTAQPAQDGGYERPEHQTEDDDKDQGQSIFHNLELLFFSLSSGPSGPGDACIFLLWESPAGR